MGATTGPVTTTPMPIAGQSYTITVLTMPASNATATATAAGSRCLKQIQFFFLFIFHRFTHIFNIGNSYRSAGGRFKPSCSNPVLVRPQ